MTVASEKSKTTILLAVAGIIGGVASAVQLGNTWFGSSAVTSYQVQQLVQTTQQLKDKVDLLPNKDTVDNLKDRTAALEKRYDETHDMVLKLDGRLSSVEAWKNAFPAPYRLPR